MRIIGAGLAGLLAANIFRRVPDLVIEESQGHLPNNHAALLRHRERYISDATGIPFREVTVHKGINYKGKFYNEANIKLANMYSQKVTGQYTTRSIWDLRPVKRYIAPQNFIHHLAQNINISFGKTFKEMPIATNVPIISTIPLPVMMTLTNWSDRPEFRFCEIYTYTARLANCDVYQTVYYPNPKLEMYRLSITGDKVIAEFMRKPEMDIAEYVMHFLELDFGIDSKELQYAEWRTSKYGKIVEIDKRARRKFISHLTSEYNIYSLGRFATWRNILLDDVYHDTMRIRAMLASRGHYTGIRDE